MARITKRFVDSLRAGPADLVHWDDELAGFGVRMKPSGVCSYLVQYRNASHQSRRLTIGRVGVLTPDEARREARNRLSEVAKGKDPVAERRAQRADILVSELVELYLDEGPASKPGKKASSWKTDASNLRRHLVPLLGRRKASTVTKGDGERFQREVTEGKTKADIPGARARGKVRVRGGAGTAARATAVAAAMFSWAVDKGHLQANPFEGIQLNRLRKRERFLTDQELADMGDHLAGMEASGVNASSLTIVRLLLLTGARLNEIAALKWTHVDSQRGLLLLPDSKTGAKVIPLGAPALAVLAAWGEQFGALRGDQYVFPAERGEGHHQGAPKVWRKLRKAAGLKGVRLHDLRHTHASAGVALNHSLFILGKILGHTKAQTTERYSHLQVDPVRAAADQIAGRLADALAGDRRAVGSSDVVSMIPKR